MNYQEAMGIIEKANELGSVLGLTNITRLLHLLGDPQEQCQVIHIAGTNGKGSILAYLDSIFREAGYTVGRYVSPTIFEYRERFQINGCYISEEDFVSCMERVQKAVQIMEKKGYEQPTVYEMETAVSFLYFLDKKTDIVLLETGLGGRLDATNAVKKPLCEVIASISMDHMQFLGDTLEQIAWEKAGIIKPDTRVVASPNPPEVLEIIKRTCRERHAALYIAEDQYQILSGDLGGQDFRYQGEDYHIRMLGEHQIKNAVTAIEVCCMISGFSISREQIKRGLAAAVWKGRFEVVQNNPLVIRDGAHNQEAAYALRHALQAYLPDYRLVYIMGVFADKEYEKMAAITAPLASAVFTIRPAQPRGLPAEVLAEAVKPYCGNVTPVGTLERAFEEAERLAEYLGKEKTAIILFGSLSFIGGLEGLIRESKYEVS